MLRLTSIICVMAAAVGLVAWQEPAWLLALGMDVARLSTPLATPPAWVVAAGIIGAAALAGAVIVVQNRQGREAVAGPLWLEEARSMTPPTRFAWDYRRNVEALQGKLAPDIEQRGRAALARAHQMDLYWRFVGRNRTSRSGVASGERYQRWLSTSRATLRAVALSPEARLLSAYQVSKAGLDQVGGPAAQKVGQFYRDLGEGFAAYEAAWLRAYSELAKPVVNRDAVLVAMEKLRRINRQIAEGSARLHGPIEICVRAVN